MTDQPAPSPRFAPADVATILSDPGPVSNVPPWSGRDLTVPQCQIIEQIAAASWASTDGYATSIPWPPALPHCCAKERRRAWAMLAEMISLGVFIPGPLATSAPETTP